VVCRPGNLAVGPGGSLRSPLTRYSAAAQRGSSADRGMYAVFCFYERDARTTSTRAPTAVRRHDGRPLWIINAEHRWRASWRPRPGYVVNYYDTDVSAQYCGPFPDARRTFRVVRRAAALSQANYSWEAVESRLTAFYERLMTLSHWYQFLYGVMQ